MKILRKRVGSFIINSNEEDYIIKEDSIYLNNEIIYNYLPIKNLSFFSLNIKKSTNDKKCWVYLDLNLNKLYLFLKDGKVLTNRKLLFDLINYSYKRKKIFNFYEIFNEEKNNFFSEKNSFVNKCFNNEINFNRKINIFEKKFVKFGKVFFDLEKRLITINKCKIWKVKIPNYFIVNNYSEVKLFYKLLDYDVLKEGSKSELNKNNLIIISKNEYSFFKTFINKKIKSSDNNFFKGNRNNLQILSSSSLIVYTEDLNFQMFNYFNEVENDKNENSNITDFIDQLKFESKNFFYNKKNIFILSKNLNKYSMLYLSNCTYENIFLINSQKLTNNLKTILNKFDDYRIDHKEKNIIFSEYIIKNNLYALESNENIKIVNYDIDGFPLEIWKKTTDLNFLHLYKKNRLISNFIKIGKKDDWNKEFLNELVEIENNHGDDTNKDKENVKCPISLTNLDSFAVKTNCNHKFNLIPLLKWIAVDQKSECKNCPVCRNKLFIENFEFFYQPNFCELIKLINENLWIVVIDDQWNNFIDNNSLQNFEENNSTIIKTSEFSTYHLNNKLKDFKHIEDTFILNLSQISDLDIKEILEVPNDIKLSFVSITNN